MIDLLPEETVEFYNTYGGPLQEIQTEPWLHDKITEIPIKNLKEFPLEYQLYFKLQGYKKEDFSVEVEKSIITISFEKEQNELDERAIPKVIYSCFSRSFYLPKDAHGELIKARYESGILQVRIPKLRPCDQKALQREKEMTANEAVLVDEI